jgi:hypothetical protein
MSAADTRAALRRLGPPAVILCGFAVVVLYLLREILVDSGRAPGRDSVNLHVWEVYTRSVLAAGRLPFWNPFHFAGTPHLADPQTTVLYPPAVLLRWISPPQVFLAWMAALHIWIGGAGALLLGRLIGLGWIAATAAALAAMLGGSTGGYVHNGHLLPMYVVSWMPWAIALSILSLRRDTVWPHPALVLVMVLQFLVGYLQVSVYFAGAVCLWFLLNAAWPERQGRNAAPRALAQLAILGVLALGVSAFQLFPTTRLVLESARSFGIPYEEAIEDAWRWRSFATLFFPLHAVPLETPHRYLTDAGSYVGWALTALAPMAFLDRDRRRIAVLLGALLVLALALAIVDLPFYRLLHELVPGFRRPSRVLFIATVSLAMLGGLGLERFLILAADGRRRPLAAGVSIAVAAVAGAALIVAAKDGFLRPPAPVWPWLPFIAAGGVVAAFAAASRAWVRTGAVVVLMVVAIDVVGFTAGAPTTVPMELPATIRGWMGQPSAGRALSTCEHRIGAGEMLRIGQPGLDGMAGIHLGSYSAWAFLARFGNAPAWDGVLRHMNTEGPLPDRRDQIDLANVSVIFSCRPLDEPALTLVSEADEAYVYRNDAVWPRGVWTCEAPTMTEAAAIAQLLQSRYDREKRLRPTVHINVRWASGVDDSQRTQVEQRFGLANGVVEEGRTWRYAANDPSPANMLALVADPAVEDTHGFDRLTGNVQAPVVVAPGRPADHVVVGGAPCSAKGTVTVLEQDRSDGLFVAEVAAPVPGLVFMSEPFYVERHAFVDGRRVTPLPANLAFTAVPVGAGRHRVELRYVPESFYLGLGATGLTLAGWTGLARLTRRRRSDAAPAAFSEQ